MVRVLWIDKENSMETTQEAAHTAGRIDRAIAACELVDADGRNGRFVSWSAFCAARDAAECEYQAALTELSIRATRAAIAAKATGAAA